MHESGVQRFGGKTTLITKILLGFRIPHFRLNYNDLPRIGCWRGGHEAQSFPFVHRGSEALLWPAVQLGFGGLSQMGPPKGGVKLVVSPRKIILLQPDRQTFCALCAGCLVFGQVSSLNKPTRNRDALVFIGHTFT